MGSRIHHNNANIIYKRCSKSSSQRKKAWLKWARRIIFIKIDQNKQKPSEKFKIRHGARIDDSAEVLSDKKFVICFVAFPPFLLKMNGKCISQLSGFLESLHESRPKATRCNTLLQQNRLFFNSPSWLDMKFNIGQSCFCQLTPITLSNSAINWLFFKNIKSHLSFNWNALKVSTGKFISGEVMEVMIHPNPQMRLGQMRRPIGRREKDVQHILR